MECGRRIAMIFPGQGAQAVGMGVDFVREFPAARRLMEEVDDILGRHLSRLIAEGPADLLTATANSQVALYAVSMAILRVMEEVAPDIRPSYVAGLSLGEYSALTTAGYLPLSSGVPLVQARGQYMNDACEKYPGAMAVVLGLPTSAVVELVASLDMPGELWVANLNCPGQTVLSGTVRGIEAAKGAAVARGAKGVLPLQVHGAFHSGLMQEAADKLAPELMAAGWKTSEVPIALNVTGETTTDLAAIRDCLVRQVTAPVLWERDIRAIVDAGVDLFLEVGSGTTLAGLNKRIGVTVPTYSIGKLSDLDHLSTCTTCRE